LKDKPVLRVRKDLCLGCGLCAETCPRQAISLVSAAAEIDQGRCNQCHLCIEVCPQDAIVESAPVSEAEVVTMVTSLRQKADDIVKRIERLRQQEKQSLY
jgi:formate hydrogenlyase subunit 6/NADH:ubiquinone oxidoreductase subunit I